MKKDNSYKVHFAGCHTREVQQTLIGLYLRDHALPNRLTPTLPNKVAREVAALRSKANRILNPYIK